MPWRTRRIKVYRGRSTSASQDWVAFVAFTAVLTLTIIFCASFGATVMKIPR